MKEKWELFKGTLTETVSMSKREYLLTIAVGILGGIVLGFIFSPRKHTVIASNNGNSNGNNNGNGSGNAAGKDGEEEIADWDEEGQL